MCNFGDRMSTQYEFYDADVSKEEPAEIFQRDSSPQRFNRRDSIMLHEQPDETQIEKLAKNVAEGAEKI